MLEEVAGAGTVLELGAIHRAGKGDLSPPLMNTGFRNDPNLSSSNTRRHGTRHQLRTELGGPNARLTI